MSTDAPDNAQWLFGSNVVGFDLSEMSGGASEGDFCLGGGGMHEQRRHSRKKRSEKPTSRSGIQATTTTAQSVQDRPLHHFTDDATTVISIGEITRHDRSIGLLSREKRRKKKPAFSFDESGGEEGGSSMYQQQVKETSLDFMDGPTTGSGSVAEDAYVVCNNRSSKVQQWTSMEMNSLGLDSESPAEELDGTMGLKQKYHRSGGGASKSKGEKARGMGRRDSNGATSAKEAEDISTIVGGSRKGGKASMGAKGGRLGEDAILSEKKASGASTNSTAFLSDDGGVGGGQRFGKPPVHWQTSLQELEEGGSFENISSKPKDKEQRRRGGQPDSLDLGSSAVPKKKRSNSKDAGFNASFNNPPSRHTHHASRKESPFPSEGYPDDTASCCTSSSLMGTLKSKQFPKLGGGGNSSPGGQSIEFDPFAAMGRGDHSSAMTLDPKSSAGGWTVAGLGALPPIQLHTGLQPPQSKHGRTASSSSTLAYE